MNEKLKKMKEWTEEVYGIRIMNLDEELALTDNERSTRNCKMEIVDVCKHLKQCAEYMEDYAKRMPVKDNDRHAEMVRRLRNKVKDVEVKMESACLYDGRDVV